MRWRRAIPLLLLASNALAADGYVLGFGIEGDTSDGLGASAIADIALSENTWLTAAVARTTVDLPRLQSLDTWYGDLGLDHWFDPVGIRIGAAYWGDSDILDSVDWRGSLYWRGSRATLAVDYEHRAFEFELPAVGTFPGRVIQFNANGIGLSARFELSDETSLSIFGMDYDYNKDLRIGSNRGILELLSFSRLSLINSLVDYSAGITFGLESGNQRWQFDVGTWRGEVDAAVTRSAMVRLMTPLGEYSDIEFGLGVDDSELYGTVTFASVFLYFYR